MAPRRRRRRTTRWVLVALLLSLVTVSVSMVSSAQTDGPARRFSELAYLDSLRPVVERSSAQGTELAHLRSLALRLGREAVRRQAARVSQDARAVLGEVERAQPPKSLTTSHSILVATMAVRARAAAAVDAALAQAYAGGPTSHPVDALGRAGEDMLAADRTYQVFLESLPTSEGSPPVMPPSRWVPDPRLWDRNELGVFLGALRASATAGPVHDLSLLVVTTKPPAVGNEGAAVVLPLVRSFQVEVVVGNVGNAAERDVPVVASLTGAAGAGESVRGVVDLEPGQRRSLTLAGLAPVPAGPGTLRVMVGPVPGEANSADNQRVTPVVLRGG
jgi:hypothetical protein